MKKVIVIGDLHFRSKEVYYKSVRSWMDWFLESEYNSEDYITIFLGDMTEYSINRGDLNGELLGFIKSLQSPNVYILQGNHDIKFENGSNLDIFMNEEKVEVIYQPIVRKLGNMNCLFLPHILSTAYDQPMEDYYSNVEYKDHYDYCFAHIEDETQKRSEKHKVCDLSHVDIGKRIFGHIHTYNLDQNGSYLGSVVPNSSTETTKTPFIYEIDLETGEGKAIPCPLFLNYYTVTYPEHLPEIKEDYFLLTIKKSVDRKTSIDYYTKQAEEQGKDLYVRRVERFRTIERPEEDNERNSDQELSNKEFADLFYKKFNISNEVQSIIMKCVN